VGPKAAVEGYRSAFLFVRKHRSRASVTAMRLAVLGGVTARLIATTLAFPVAWALRRGKATADRLRTYAAVWRMLLFGPVYPDPDQSAW
jgi:ABC-type sulfate transport system permease component